MAANADRKLRYQHVYDLVLHIMAERGLKPGDRLPSTTELAGIAEVSIDIRTTGARRTRAGGQDPAPPGARYIRRRIAHRQRPDATR